MKKLCVFVLFIGCSENNTASIDSEWEALFSQTDVMIDSVGARNLSKFDVCLMFFVLFFGRNKLYLQAKLLFLRAPTEMGRNQLKITFERCSLFSFFLSGLEF